MKFFGFMFKTFVALMALFGMLSATIVVAALIAGHAAYEETLPDIDDYAVTVSETY